jgi:hypothetical protein
VISIHVLKTVDEHLCHLNKKSVVFVPVQNPASLSRTWPRNATPLSCGTKKGLINPIIPVIELVVIDIELTLLVALTIALTEFPASS